MINAITTISVNIDEMAIDKRNRAVLLNASNCISEKRGSYGSCTVIVHVCLYRDFLVFKLQATFLLGFLLNFASGLLWPRSGHPIILVARESKLCFRGQKCQKF